MKKNVKTRMPAIPSFAAALALLMLLLLASHGMSHISHWPSRLLLRLR